MKVHTHSCVTTLERKSAIKGQGSRNDVANELSNSLELFEAKNHDISSCEKLVSIVSH